MKGFGHNEKEERSRRRRKVGALVGSGEGQEERCRRQPHTVPDTGQGLID